MRHKSRKVRWVVMGALLAFVTTIGAVYAAEMVQSSYSPVVIKEPFAETMDRMKAAKPEVMERQMELLNKRYDLSKKSAKGVTSHDLIWITTCRIISCPTILRPFT